MSNSSIISMITDISDHEVLNADNLVIHSNVIVWTICLSLITVLANLGTIIAFWKVKSLGEKPADLLILSLAFIDLFQGLIMLPFHMSLDILDGRWIWGELGCKFYVPMALASITNGLLILCTISLDRLLLVKLQYPKYMKFQSKPRVLLAISICWLLSLVPAVIDVGFWEYAKSLNNSVPINFDFVCLSPTRWMMPKVSLVFLFTFFFMPVFLVAVFSLSFLHALHLRLQKIRRVGPEDEIAMPNSNSSTTGSMSSGKRLQRSRNRYIKPAMTLGALVAAMCVSILPYLSYVVVVGLICPTCLNPLAVHYLVFLLYLTPLLDPIMYGITESKLRKFYVSCFKRLIKRR
ncbi:5-hydroxytryptamine receptor 7-like [Amphiura filiformis]|uniref:5-hydroxytryptamine receptor 7-like n=1 Tax=Amphiura filiformis TaxID=82378 RepID=UPI003B21DF72